jgi:hypothetical protein
MSLKLLLDENMSQTVAAQVQQQRPLVVKRTHGNLVWPCRSLFAENMLLRLDKFVDSVLD